jgi:hypothetical protein
MRRPLGCFTFSALVAAVLVVLAILGAEVVTGNGIFSPGQLSAVVHGTPLGGVGSHAELEGRCDACHTAAWSGERMADRCQACHTQVQQEIASGGGLHGRLTTSATNCRTCHTEHRGATASVTLADPHVFPHEDTGYSLVAHSIAGPGGGVGCRDCHPGSPVTFTAPTCIACHQALNAPFMTTHLETFGSTCLNCHDGVESYGASFTHSTYKLTGGHEGPVCSECHHGATTLTALQATSTECVSCHAAKDIHEGRLGTACAQCHTTATWADATIDHDRTRFALVGQHVGTLCESCHVDRHWTGIGMTCRSCHAAVNPHGTQFPGDCASCHAATGWKDVTFDHAKTRFALTLAHAKPACVACHAGGRYVGTPTACSACHTKPSSHAGSAFNGTCSSCHTAKAWLPASFNHAKTAFPLTGAHLSTTCQKCHKGGVLKGTPTACSACHTKPSSHAGSAFSGTCSSCHTTKAWLPATFNHGKTAFPLTGAHLSTTCQKCHKGGVLKGTPTACSACHTKPSSHGSAFSGTCSSCHTTKAWLPATFNHSKTAFPLTGAHLSTTCQKCHKGGVLKGTPTACSACHTKPASHDSAYSGTCSSCHTTKAWLPASFNHSKTAFPLTGAHLSVTCQKCHKGGVTKGTPTACSACHTKPASHGANFSNTCSTCHTTKAWRPASYNGPHTFPQTHQGAGGVCATCHPSSFTSYTCAKCHSNSSMTSKHTDVSGFSLTTCAKCHPKGTGGG